MYEGNNINQIKVKFTEPMKETKKREASGTKKREASGTKKIVQPSSPILNFTPFLFLGVNFQEVQ